MSSRVTPLGPEHLAAAAALLGRACPFDAAAEVASEKLFGIAPLPSHSFGAWRGDVLVGVAVASGRWARILAVDPSERGKGVGTWLLRALEQAARGASARVLRTCDQPGNYLSPGIDVRDAETLGWLARRGFVAVGENENLTVPLADNALVTDGARAAAVERATASGYSIARAAAGDGRELDRFVTGAFGSGWSFEIMRALEASTPSVFVARKGGQPVAFAAHDGNNRGLGWFGPAGTLPEHRGGGLGAALLLLCLRDIAAFRPQADIAWIGPRQFYEKTAGAVQGRRFQVWEKTL